MRKYINILYFFVSILITLSFTACDQDNEREFYDASLVPAYSMFQSNMVTELATENEGILKVKVTRTNVNEEATVNIAITATDPSVLNLFSLKSTTLTFPKGVASVDAEVIYDLSLLDIDPYSFSISLADPKSVSLGGFTSTAVKASVKLLYEDYKLCQFTSEAFYDEGVVKNVMVQKAAGVPYFKIVDPYVAGYPIYFGMDPNMTTINDFGTQETGVQHSTLGMMSIVYYESEVVDNVLKFTVEVRVTAGFFEGTYLETLTFPVD